MPHPRSTISAPAPTDGDERRAHDAAVIDVGSNSVRLVIYRVDGRAMTPMLNEKVMAGLGRHLSRTGKLSPAGVIAASRAMARFRAIMESLHVTEVRAVATAAVREAEDGAAFAQRLEAETGIRLRILTGAEEARFSAAGVLAGAPDAEGLVGDLGGSSLELVEVGGGKVGRGETFPLGHLALGEGYSYERIAAAADAALDRARERLQGDLYAVGGAWRAIGRIEMSRADHPVHVLHHYEMNRAEALKIAEFVRKQSPRSLERLESAAARRAESLPFAATVLERLLLRGKFERVIISSYGLREGVLLEALDMGALGNDPLIAAAEAFGGERNRVFGAALGAWIEPAFEGAEPIFGAKRDTALRGAAARLADLGAPLHPDQRGELIYDLVLRAQLAAISHPERAFLAACVHHRYTKSMPDFSQAYVRLLSEDARRRAVAVGAALRLGADLSGRSELLNRFALKREGALLTLRVAQADELLMTDQAARRLDALGNALGLTAQVVIG